MDAHYRPPVPTTGTRFATLFHTSASEEKISFGGEFFMQEDSERKNRSHLKLGNKIRKVVASGHIEASRLPLRCSTSLLLGTASRLCQVLWPATSVATRHPPHGVITQTAPARASIIAIPESNPSISTHRRGPTSGSLSLAVLGVFVDHVGTSDIVLEARGKNGRSRVER